MGYFGKLNFSSIIKTYDLKGCCIILTGAGIKRNPYEWIVKKLIWLWKVINPTHLTNVYPRATKKV